MNQFPRHLVTDARGRSVRLPDAATIQRIPVVARELERLTGELWALGIEAPTIEARFLALSIKHRRELAYVDAGIVSRIGYSHLRYLQHFCPELVIGYDRGVFSVRRRDAADEAAA